MQGAVGLGGKPIKVNAAVQKGQSKPATDTSSMNQYYQQYQQQYQQYLTSYYQQTGVYPQQPQQQPASLGQYYPAQYSQQGQSNPQPDDQELVDPNPELNVAELNKEIIDTEKRLYFELEEARWNPLETYASTVPTSKVLT